MARVPTDGQTSKASLSPSVALTLATHSDHLKRVSPSPGPPLAPQTLTWVGGALALPCSLEQPCLPGARAPSGLALTAVNVKVTGQGQHPWLHFSSVRRVFSRQLQASGRKKGNHCLSKSFFTSIANAFLLSSEMSFHLPIFSKVVDLFSNSLALRPSFYLQSLSIQDSRTVS